MIGLIGAMAVEVEALEKKLEGRRETTIGMDTFVSGKLFGQDAVLAVCGPGKVNAAVCTQKMITAFSPDWVLNLGVAGAGADGRHYLVLDGWTGISGNNLASVLLRFDEDTQQMVPADQISTEKLYTASLRNVPSLVSQDLDGDGIVEIPTQPDEAGLLNMSQSRRMDFIVWMDYTSPHPEKSFGLLDEETNCYIELPMEWEGNLKLTDSEQYDGAVELRTVDEDQLVMTLRLVRTTSSLKGWTRLGIVASRQMQAKLAPDVEIRDKNYRLSKALYLLN